MTSPVPTQNVKLKRAYDAAEPADGVRILVDRLWPRGLSKAHAALDRWDKEIAPSTALREWFGHDPARWTTFQSEYAAELAARPDAVRDLRNLAHGQPITLIYAAHDTAHNHARVLRNVILNRSP